MVSRLPTIAKAVERIRQQELTPADLVETCLERIRRFDERVRAWVMVDEPGARRRAEQLTEMAAKQQWLGPLHGIPVAIKDIVDVEGWPTQAGSPLRTEHVADRDAPVVARLRAAGAIILGKTVTTQFACFDPPVTRNPWNLQHTPGGSSSGSAAAAAMEMCLAAIGSQTGGSITRPATYCGVAGLKPTFDAVDVEGVVPVSPVLDHVGPIARTAADLASVFSVIASNPTNAKQQREQAARPRLLAVESFFEQADPEVERVTREALGTLTGSISGDGSLSLPDLFDDVARRHRTLMAADAARYHRQAFRDHRDAFAPKLAGLIDEGLAVSDEQYRSARQHQQQLRSTPAEQWLPPAAVAVMPATVDTAPASLDTTGDPRFNSLWSYAGLPVVSIPCGRASNGMPCGLQLIGPPGSEPGLIATAAWCERQLNLALLPDLLHE